MNAAVYDCALKSLVEVLENSFGAGASRVDVKLRTLTSGALELLFVDDGHGVTGELSAVYCLPSTTPATPRARAAP